jgi:hypothetical protein
MRRRMLALVALAVLAAAAGAARGGALAPLGKENPRKAGGLAPGVTRGALDCSGAVEVVLDVVYHDTNAGRPDNVTYYGCSAWEESGGEVVYHLTLAEPTMFRATLEPYGCDLDLAVLDACDEVLGCQVVADVGVVTNEPVTGEFWFVVDGYLGESCAFDLVVEWLPPPPSACGHLRQPVSGEGGAVIPGGVFTVAGNTCDSQNMVASLGCAVYAESGYDHWYEMVLLPEAAFQFDLAHGIDGALWVLSACEELSDPDCLAFADENWPAGDETIYYQNDTGARQRVFLVIDSYDTDSCGAYTGTLTIFAPGIVEAQASSWGAVKSRYR